MAPQPRPLDGVRVLDLTDGPGAGTGRLLADLGADVLLVELPGGAGARTAAPSLSMASACRSSPRARTSAGWRSTGPRRPAATHCSHSPPTPTSCSRAKRRNSSLPPALGADELHAANPRLVITSVTDFGQTGPYRDWVGTDWVHLALSSVLSRSGSPGRPPLMPPGRLATEHAAAQATWATLVAYWSALRDRTGRARRCFGVRSDDAEPRRRLGHGWDRHRWHAGERPAAGSPGRQLPVPDLPVHRRPCPARACWPSGNGTRCSTGSGEPAEFADPKYDDECGPLRRIA